jgi:glutamate synthase domain-containing protein 2
LALNQAAFEGGFYQNTGEAGISPYHFGVDVDLESQEFDMDKFIQDLHKADQNKQIVAGDIVWQIGTGYFGCRKPDGTFDPENFRIKSQISNVKMIEIKLSQGVEPRKEMPVKMLTPGIAKVMGIAFDQEPVLKEQHSRVSTPLELMDFIAELRKLSGGKPIGIKLGLTHKHSFLALCKAMRISGIMPDFITIDGMEAGTAAASKCASGYTGTLLNESIVFIHNALVGANLREHIRIIASGKVFTERDIISKLARGADLCATARAMLIAAGCDQQRECYLGTCHMGIATQDPKLTALFDIEKNKNQMVNFHRITLQELNELIAIAGLKHPSELSPHYIQKRVSLFESKTLDELYEFIPAGKILSPFPWLIPSSFRLHWKLAKADMPFSEQLQSFKQHKGLPLWDSHSH